MLKNLEEAKKGHKKNKSEQFSKPHQREFSLFDSSYQGKMYQKKKNSKN